MKKFISFVLCLIILIGVLILPEPIEAHAEESTGYENYNRYYIRCLYSRGPGVKDSGLLRCSGGYTDCDFSIDKKLALVKKVYQDGSGDSNGSVYCEMRLYLFDESGVYLAGDYNNFGRVQDYVSYVLHKPSLSIRGQYYFYEGDNYEWKKKDIEVEREDSFGAVMTWGSAELTETGFFHTNIPIFASEEQVYQYINGEIDERSALNYASDISDIRYDLEVPKNIKIKDIQESLAPGYFLITWEQTDENYKNWQTEIYRYVDFKYRNSVLIFSWADWKYVDDYYVGQTIVETHKLSYKHRHMENVDDDELVDRITSQYPTEYGGVYKYGDEKIYMRNYYFDGQYRHYSNWIVLEFDPEEDAWINPNMNSSVVEKEGSELITDSSGVPIQPDSDLVIDSEYTGVINENYERVDGTDLISWIKSGFGIGGENGVLAIMKESFSFIPGEIWAVFVAGISLMVVVAVFKFIRG